MQRRLSSPVVEEGCGFFGRKVSGIDRLTGAFWIPSLGVNLLCIFRSLSVDVVFFSSVSGDGFVYLVAHKSFHRGLYRRWPTPSYSMAVILNLFYNTLPSSSCGRGWAAPEFLGAPTIVAYICLLLEILMIL